MNTKLLSIKNFYLNHIGTVTILLLIAIEVIKESLLPPMSESCNKNLQISIGETILIGGIMEIFICFVGLVFCICHKKWRLMFGIVILGTLTALWSFVSLFRFMCG